MPDPDSCPNGAGLALGGVLTARGVHKDYFAHPPLYVLGALRSRRRGRQADVTGVGGCSASPPNISVWNFGLFDRSGSARR